MVKFVKPLRPWLFSCKKISPGRDKSPREHPEESVPSSRELQNINLNTDLQANLLQIKTIFSDCSDVVYREFDFAQDERIKLALIYIEGMADKIQISAQILRSLMLDAPLVDQGRKFDRSRALALIKKKLLPVQVIEETNNTGKVIDAVLAGDSALLIDGHVKALIISSRGWEARNVEESQTEMTIRGPREAFVETIRINISLLRRKIKSPNLKIETMKVGMITKTDVAVVYIKGIASEKLVAEVKGRLSRIKIDGILESGYIEELIEDCPWSPFPTVAHSEKPDKIAAQLLEGRVAILVDGTPYALTVPFLFVEALQFPEDYYERSLVSSAVRLLRLVFMVVSLVLPSLYIAVITYHHEMLPTPLLLSLAAQHEAVPYPALFEVLVMEISFEILREAGVRLPRQVGQAVSIVGALVIGEAAVRAGLVGAGTVIVVALTGIASFTLYFSASFSIRFLRFPMLILAGTLGLFGLLCGVLAVLVHMAALRSFGVPYLYPAAPFNAADMKDTAARAPWWAMLRRPRLARSVDLQREAAGLKPAPPQAGRKK